MIASTARAALTVLALSVLALPGCAAPEIAGCWERCGSEACTDTEGVFLSVSDTAVQEIAADGGACTYTYLAQGRGYTLTPTGCTLDGTGLPEVVYWDDVARDDETGRLSYTQTRVFSEEAGLDDQVNSYTFQTYACDDLPEVTQRQQG